MFLHIFSPSAELPDFPHLAYESIYLRVKLYNFIIFEVYLILVLVLPSTGIAIGVLSNT